MQKESITYRNVDLFDTPIRQKKVREGVWANQYRNGVININGQKYVGYSMTEAIRQYRRDYPAYNN